MNMWSHFDQSRSSAQARSASAGIDMFAMPGAYAGEPQLRIAIHLYIAAAQ
jgi:hypothetical protein